MSLYKNSKKIFLTKGDFKPASLFKGNTFIGGARDESISGKNISVTNQYDVCPSEIRINGGNASKNLFNIDAFLAAKGNSKYYKKNENNELVQLVPDYRQYAVLASFLELPPGTYYMSAFGTTATQWRILADGEIMTSPFTLTATSKITFKSWFPTGSVIGKFQLEKGDKTTEYEEYREPYEPTLIWNGEEIHIPYILSENDYIKCHGNKVEYFKYTTSTLEDITDTQLGQKLLLFKNSNQPITASIPYSSLSVTTKVNK